MNKYVSFYMLFIIFIDKIFYLISFLYIKEKIRKFLELAIYLNRFSSKLIYKINEYFEICPEKVFAYTKKAHFYIFEYLQRKIAWYLINGDDIVIDVGASAGAYSVLLSRKVKNGKIYAFEPNPYATILLYKKIKRYNLKNIIVVQKAVSNRNGTIRLFLNKDRSGSSIFKYDHYSSYEMMVETVKLDNYIKERKIDLIKIDAEGAELLILEGMKNLLKSTRVIICEYWPEGLIKMGFNPENLLKIFKENNFYLFYFEDNKLKPIYNIKDFVKKNYIGNILAINLNFLLNRNSIKI